MDKKPSHQEAEFLLLDKKPSHQETEFLLLMDKKPSHQETEFLLLQDKEPSDQETEFLLLDKKPSHQETEFLLLMDKKPSDQETEFLLLDKKPFNQKTEVLPHQQDEHPLNHHIQFILEKVVKDSSGLEVPLHEENLQASKVDSATHLVDDLQSRETPKRVKISRSRFICPRADSLKCKVMMIQNGSEDSSDHVDTMEIDN